MAVRGWLEMAVSAPDMFRLYDPQIGRNGRSKVEVMREMQRQMFRGMSDAQVQTYKEDFAADGDDVMARASLDEVRTRLDEITLELPEEQLCEMIEMAGIPPSDFPPEHWDMFAQERGFHAETRVPLLPPWIARRAPQLAPHGPDTHRAWHPNLTLLAVEEWKQRAGDPQGYA
eukprot:222929-Rhodomonas_salina.1